MNERTPLDLETRSAGDLYRLRPMTRDYVRLTGIGPDVFTPSPPVFPVRTPYVTVNGNYFDFPALDRHCGIPVESTIPFSRDLRVAAFQHDPPTSYQTKAGPGFKPYSLDALGERYLGIPKSETGKQLAKEYGGWDHIPVDDPRYVKYCHDDLELTAQLDAVIPYHPYEQREAWVSAITARATLSGFRVDLPGLYARAHELQARARDGKTLLQSYGFPLTNKAGKPAAAPQRTNAGKEAMGAALAATGFPVDRWPVGKDGTLQLGKDVLEAAHARAVAEYPDAVVLIEAVQTMNGIRNTAENILRCVSGDRVHPQFLPFQNTKRWSVLEPGLTVAKKGVADSERMFLLADPGEVLVSIDLDQIDIRCVAAHSQDHNLIDILNDPTRDIHSEVSLMAFGSAEGKHRHHAKSLDLGWLYGRTVNGLAQTPGMTREIAVKVDDSMRSQFGQVMRWQRDVRERGSAGLMLDNGFGGRLRVEQDRAFTQAPGVVGQSTTRELIAEGLLDLARTAPEVLPMLRMIVHDEVVASVPKESAEEVARIIQRCMSRSWAPAGASRPVSVTAGQGKPFVFAERWGSLYM